MTSAAQCAQIRNIVTRPLATLDMVDMALAQSYRTLTPDALATVALPDLFPFLHP